MAKEKTESEIREKKERKEKKEKRRKQEEDEVEIVSEKKKKDKKRKNSEAAVDADGDIIVDAVAEDVKEEEDEDEGGNKKPIMVKMEIPLAALVPFAKPLCDDRSQKKVFKVVKRAAKHKSLKRGVKEVVKCIRKSPLAAPSTPATALPNGIVVLAADISPMDVISHIPVLCEDHNIPYMYVPSRAELGAAGSTKRPTSVVMMMPKARQTKVEDSGAEDKEDWEEQFRDLHKLSLKMGQHVKV